MRNVLLILSVVLTALPAAAQTKLAGPTEVLPGGFCRVTADKPVVWTVAPEPIQCDEQKTDVTFTGAAGTIYTVTSLGIASDGKNLEKARHVVKFLSAAMPARPLVAPGPVGIGSTAEPAVRPREELASERLKRLRAMPMFLSVPGKAGADRPRTTVGEWLDSGGKAKTLSELDGWLSDDDVIFLDLYNPRPALGVAAPEVFRGFRPAESFDPDHQCDRCGAFQYTIAGAGPLPGTHRHVCPRCGNAWYH